MVTLRFASQLTSVSLIYNSCVLKAQADRTMAAICQDQTASEIMIPLKRCVHQSIDFQV